MNFYSDAFFWAFVALVGLVGANAVVAGQKSGKSALFGLCAVGLVVAALRRWQAAAC